MTRRVHSRSKHGVALLALLCCLGMCVAVARAAPLTTEARLPGAKPELVDLIAPLGHAWGQDALRDLAAAFRITGRPIVERGDLTTFLQNYALGVELTFRYVRALDHPRPGARPGMLVLNNIRLYGAGSRTHAAFKGDLPFGLRFGDTKEMLIAKLGPPDLELQWQPLLRWDTARYALFAALDKDGRLDRFSLQLPVVSTDRPGFEAR